LEKQIPSLRNDSQKGKRNGKGKSKRRSRSLRDDSQKDNGNCKGNATITSKGESGPKLFFQEGFEEGFYVAGYLLVALGGGVGGVFLHVAGDAVDVFEEEGEEVDFVLLR